MEIIALSAHLNNTQGSNGYYVYVIQNELTSVCATLLCSWWVTRSLSTQFYLYTKIYNPYLPVVCVCVMYTWMSTLYEYAGCEWMSLSRVANLRLVFTVYFSLYLVEWGERSFYKVIWVVVPYFIRYMEEIQSVKRIFLIISFHILCKLQFIEQTAAWRQTEIIFFIKLKI